MNILYGVPSEGMGHATRSKVVIEHLLKKHNVRIVSSDRAFKFLDTHFPGRVHEIRGLHFAYKDAAVSKMRTFKEVLKNAPEDLKVNFRKYKELHESFQPDVVITDFETFSYLFGLYHKIPVISIDNIQALHRGKLDISITKEEKGNFKLAKAIVKARVPGCDHYFVTSFFPFEFRKDRTTIVPPILRDGIIAAKPSNEKHIIVYQTSTSQTNIVKVLNEVKNETFLLYGFNREEVQGNVIMKAFSEEGFINDLASAKAVLSNGGFSLLSEAVYLHKPVCSIPVQGQFEQFMNASYIDKMGYGRYFPEFTSDAIKAFLYDLDFFRENLKNYRQNGNKELFSQVDTCLKNIETALKEE